MSPTDEKPRSYDDLSKASPELLDRKLAYAQEHYIRASRAGARIAAKMYAREVTKVEDEIARREIGA